MAKRNVSVEEQSRVLCDSFCLTSRAGSLRWARAWPAARPLFLGEKVHVSVHVSLGENGKEHVKTAIQKSPCPQEASA